MILSYACLAMMPILLGRKSHGSKISGLPTNSDIQNTRQPLEIDLLFLNSRDPNKKFIYDLLLAVVKSLLTRFRMISINYENDEAISKHFTAMFGQQTNESHPRSSNKENL